MSEKTTEDPLDESESANNGRFFETINRCFGTKEEVAETMLICALVYVKRVFGTDRARSLVLRYIETPTFKKNDD